MDLQDMTTEQLHAHKAEQYRVAEVTGCLGKIADVARWIGQDPVSIREPGYRSTHGPKYQHSIGDIVIYVDDYGRYMTVHVNGKRVCSTHQTDRLFVSGEWSSIVVAHWSKAKAVRDAKIANQVEQERQRLLDTLQVVE